MVVILDLLCDSMHTSHEITYITTLHSFRYNFLIVSLSYTIHVITIYTMEVDLGVKGITCLLQERQELAST